MNLIEAIKSGRPFRRRGDTHWYAKFDGCLSERFRCGPEEDIHLELLMGAVIADDWEIQEPTVTITRTQLLTAYADVLKARNVKYMRVGGVDDVYPGDFQNGDIVELAKRLGLGEP